MSHQRSGQLDGDDEHVFFWDQQNQSGVVVRMYQFQFQRSGGAYGMRTFKGEVTTSLEQAKADREKCFKTLKKKEIKIEKSKSGTLRGDGSSPRSPSPVSPGSQRRSIKA